MNKQIDVVAAIIEKDGKVFAARRKQGRHLAGFWEFPGGKIEPGEAPEQSLERELKEELGLRVSVAKYFGESVHDYGSKIVRLIAFRVEQFQGTIELVDHDEVRWLTVEELDDVQWADADKPLVNSYLSVEGAR